MEAGRLEEGCPEVTSWGPEEEELCLGGVGVPPEAAQAALMVGPVEPVAQAQVPTSQEGLRDPNLEVWVSNLGDEPSPEEGPNPRDEDPNPVERDLLDPSQ